MCTTDSQNLKPTLKSRAFTLHLNHLTQKQMVELLKRVVVERQLRIQAESATLSMIAAWADGKPRIALNLLEGFTEGSAITQDMVKEFIDYIGVDELLPLLSCLGGSMMQGLSYINEMKMNNSMVNMLVEILKVRSGMASFKLSYTDTHKVRSALKDVDPQVLVKFTYLVAGLPKLTRSGVISAFLQSHPELTAILNPVDRAEVIRAEVDAKRDAPNPEAEVAERPAAPSLEDLLAQGVTLDG